MNITNLFGQKQANAIEPSKVKWSKVSDRIYPMFKMTIPDDGTPPDIDLKEEEKPVIHSFLADVHIIYLIEYENFFTYVNHGQLKRWKIDDAVLREVATTNLTKMANEQAQFHGDSEYAMITLNGNCEASLMLLDEFWGRIAEMINSEEIVVGIPTRDVVLVTTENNKAGIDKLREGVKQTYEQGDHAVTKYIFRRENGKWSPLEAIE